MKNEFVIIESPFKGETPVEEADNIAYAREAMRDSLYRGEAPFASHLLYPQALDDGDERERSMGIEAGLSMVNSLPEQRCIQIGEFHRVCSMVSNVLNLRVAKSNIVPCTDKRCIWNASKFNTHRAMVATRLFGVDFRVDDAFGNFA